MNVQLAAVVVPIVLLIAGSALAATATGRVTYIAPDREIMLDNSDMYAVSPSVNLSSVAVADRVKVKWIKKNGKDVIINLDKTPLKDAAAG